MPVCGVAAADSKNYVISEWSRLLLPVPFSVLSHLFASIFGFYVFASIFGFYEVLMGSFDVDLARASAVFYYTIQIYAWTSTPDE